mgnify:CR=1 FL=1
MTSSHDIICLGDIMNHNSDKEHFEYLIKNMLQHYNLIDSDLHKSEKPDFRNDNLGLEVTRADQTLGFEGFISKYNKDNIKEELNEIIKLQSNYDKKFEKIIIIFIDKLCEFDLLNNTYNIIENTNEQLNNISIKTYEELSNQ